MVNYRRYFLAGGTYFFTVALRNRKATLLTDHVSLLRDAFRTVRRATPFTIDAIVVLPDHLHAIWTLPDGDADYPGRWRAIKSAFVRSLKREGVQVQRNAKVKRRSGSDATGNTRFVMSTICNAMSITFISIP